MRIYICCAGGVTSKMLARRLSAEAPDSSWSFSSISESFLEEALDEMDVLLLAPHIELAERTEARLSEAGVLTARIDQGAYAEGDAAAMYETVRRALRASEAASSDEASAEPEDAPGALTLCLHRIAGVFKLPVFSIIASAMSAVGVPMIVGSLVTTVLSLPFPAFQQLLADTGLDAVLRLPVEVSTGFVALYASFALGYCYAKSYGMDPFWVSALSAAAILSAIGADLFKAPGIELVGREDAIGYLGPYGIFPAMVCALSTCCLLRHLGGCEEGGKDAGRRLMARARSALVVLAAWAVVAALVRLGFDATPYELVNRVAQVPFALVSANISGFVVYLVFGGALWLVGLHGNMVAYAAIAPVYSMMYYANIAAFAAGDPAPYAAWFLIPFVYIGGTGSTLALNLIFLVAAKSKRARSVGGVCIASSVCNIGEPMVFGVPIMYNKDFAIPFMVCPLANLAVAWFAMFVLGAVPAPTGAAVSLYYPLGLSAVLTCGSLGAWLLWAGLLALDVMIYLPFAARFDAAQLEQERGEDPAQEPVASFGSRLKNGVARKHKSPVQ